MGSLCPMTKEDFRERSSQCFTLLIPIACCMRVLPSKAKWVTARPVTHRHARCSAEAVRVVLLI